MEREHPVPGAHPLGRPSVARIRHIRGGWASRGKGSPGGFSFVKGRQRVRLALAAGRFGRKMQVPAAFDKFA